MSISACKVYLAKQIHFGTAKGDVLHAFHRNHIRLALIYTQSGKERFSHYSCFNKFLNDLVIWLDGNCKGLWAKVHDTPDPMKAGKKLPSDYGWNDKPDGALLKLDLYFEEPDDLALFIKEKALLLKLQS
jgi:hypothetical protein